jgi:hypothetical protein
LVNAAASYRLLLNYRVPLRVSEGTEQHQAEEDA